MEVEREDPVLGEREAEELTPVLHRALSPMASCGARALEGAFHRHLAVLQHEPVQDDSADVVTVGATKSHPPSVGVELIPQEG